MEKYIEIAIDNVNNRKKIIPLSSLNEVRKKAIAEKQQLYKSYYYYDEDIIEHMKIMKSTSKYAGKFYISEIILDIDKEKNTDKFTYMKMREFCAMLNDDWNVPKESMLIWFSGTGYHIQIPDVWHFEPSNELPRQVGYTMSKYFKYADNIYNNTRIIRVGYTINNKSGLYKIPFTYDEITCYSEDQIKKQAQQITIKKIKIEPTDLNLHDYIVDISQSYVEKEITENPTKIVTCTQKMYYQGNTEGDRHKRMTAIVSHWRRNGIPQEAVLTSLIDRFSSLEKEEIQRTVEDGYKKGYIYSCNHATMVKYCDSNCIYYKNKNYNLEVTNMKELENNFCKLVRTDFSRTAFNLNEIFPFVYDNATGKYNGLNASYMFYPQEYILFIGDTGIGKTMFIQNICIALRRMRILYLSLEVGQDLMFRRFIQIAHNLSKEEVIDYYKTHHNTLGDVIGHIQMVTISPTLDNIRKVIADIQPQLVVVDTTDGITCNDAREMWKSDKVAIELKQIAQQLNTIIIGVHHISKGAIKDVKGNPKSLDVHAGKGSSAAEQKADKVISIEGTRDTNIRIIRSLKARDENGFEAKFTYSPITFKFKVKGDE